MSSAPAKPPVDLPLDYYHQNFCQVLCVVQQRYNDLLSEHEQYFLQQFYGASKGAQCLYVRLSGRSKSIFRQSKLHYAEIADLPQAVKELDRLELLSIDPDLTIEELLPLYTKPELVNLLGIAKGGQYSRTALDAHIIEQADNKTLAILKTLDTVIAVRHEEHLATFKLCFFGNLHQDLSEFVLRDLAIYQFEPYPLDTASRQFENREQLDQHLRYYACSALSEASVAAGPESIVALSQALPTPQQHDHSLERRVCRLRNQLARDLERQKRSELALQLYEQSDQPPARERRARIHMAAGDVDLSLDLCRAILLAPTDEAEAVFAQQFGQRHAKRHKKHWVNVATPAPETRMLVLAKTDCVETATASYLAERGECFFVENTLFNSVLGLAIWPEVFAPIQGAFSHPFQHRPHDFYAADFRLRRQTGVDNTLALQREDPLAFNQHVLSIYRAKVGTANPLVHWTSIDEQLLQKALQRIPVEHWQLLFERLLADLRNNRNGLPDLIYFPDAGGYELVEVKGPGDRLQDNQKRWMQFFNRHDMPHWLAQVSWIGQPSDA